MTMIDPNAEQNKKLEKAIAVLEDLAPEWKATIESAKDAEILQKIAETARNAEETELRLKEDEDILKIKEELKTAKEQFMEDRKVHKAKLFYAHHILTSRGK